MFDCKTGILAVLQHQFLVFSLWEHLIHMFFLYISFKLTVRMLISQNFFFALDGPILHLNFDQVPAHCCVLAKPSPIPSLSYCCFSQFSFITGASASLVHSSPLPSIMLHHRVSRLFIPYATDYCCSISGQDTCVCCVLMQLCWLTGPSNNWCRAQGPQHRTANRSIHSCRRSPRC